MLCKELEDLIDKYQSAMCNKQDVLFVMELRSIAGILERCGKDELYSQEITRRFCRLVDDLKFRADIPWDPEEPPERAAFTRPGNNLNYFVARQQEQHTYRNGEELLCAFYNYFRNEPKKRQGDNSTPVKYPSIESLDELADPIVNITMKDYVARIRTFCQPKYLGELCDLRQMDMDPVLFTYENLENILATFKTRDDNGEIIKQRVNIRSVLRKLNDFKQKSNQR